MKYNHLGIPTTGQFEGEIDLPHLKMTVSDHENNQFGVQWQRYWKDALYPDLVKTVIVMFTVTAKQILPCTVTGSWPRPRWFDMSLWGRPLDTCMLDVRFREKFQDALATVLSDQERAGLDILTRGDLHRRRQPPHVAGGTTGGSRRLGSPAEAPQPRPNPADGHRGG